MITIMKTRSLVLSSVLSYYEQMSIPFVKTKLHKQNFTNCNSMINVNEVLHQKPAIKDSPTVYQ
jgi:hypothetical protein